MLEIKVQGSSSAGNNYVLIDGDSSLMIEAGVKLKKILQQGVNLSPIKGLLVTHEHGDHSKYAQDILSSSGFDLYASQGTIDAIGIDRRFHVLRAGKQTIIDDWIVLPFNTIHDVAEPLGFIILSPSGEKVVFLTDTTYCPVKFPDDVSYWMVECNHSLDILDENLSNGSIIKFVRDRIIKSHMNLETCKEFFTVNNTERAKLIMLLHLSGQNSDAKRFKTEIEEVTGKEVLIA